MVSAGYLKKLSYGERVNDLLDNYDTALLVHADNVGSRQFMDIRASIRPESVVLMGKNTLMRKCITNYCKAKGDDTWMILANKLVGNVGIIFTKGDLLDVRKKIKQFVVPAPARVGAIAQSTVIVPAGPTGMEPSKTSFFQTLNIATKINKGTIEIISDVLVLSPGDRVSSSAAVLLSALKYMPFEYGLEVLEVYDKGAMYPSAVLDITNETLEAKFMSGVKQVAAFSLASNYPTLASVPHSIVNAYKNVLSISIGTDYTFELAQKVKDYLANPGAFASAAPAAAAGGAAKAAAAPEPEEEEDAAMDFDLFD
jgi:large subunit ribosomal protein LP0